MWQPKDWRTEPSTGSRALYAQLEERMQMCSHPVEEVEILIKRGEKVTEMVQHDDGVGYSVKLVGFQKRGVCSVCMAYVLESGIKTEEYEFDASNGIFMRMFMDDFRQEFGGSNIESGSEILKAEFNDMLTDPAKKAVTMEKWRKRYKFLAKEAKVSNLCTDEMCLLIMNAHHLVDKYLPRIINSNTRGW